MGSIQNALNDFSDIQLIIIDTFQKVRNIGGSAKDGMYAVDYADVSALKDIADKHKIAIVFVHHLRKIKDQNDPFNDVSGSTGIAGAADTIFIMNMSREGTNAILRVSGRDVNYQEIDLRFNNCKWELEKLRSQETIEQEQIPNFMFDLCDFLSDKKEWSGTATDLISAMGNSETPVNVVTKYLGRFSAKILEPIGIKYSTKKSGKRYIFFKR